ncbi:MAG: prepilin-type N-terminal cleavage/methylation domain-containing protein [Planctomycetes bacterium]|nr:prepilin-type N-terminal cleavage/methylation domain-containing protein [Planctomycetota bacterium]
MGNQQPLPAGLPSTGIGPRASGFANPKSEIPNPKSRIPGFTLVEVLVVVAIIALLVAILLPTLTAARAEVRRIACEANLKQLHVAWTTYLDMFKGFFPGGMNLEYNYGGLQGEGSQFFGNNPDMPVPKPLNRCLNMPLVVRTGGEVFRCPDDAGTPFVRPSARRYYGTSYFPNHLLVGRNIWVLPGKPCEAVWIELAGDPWAWPVRPGMLENLNRAKVDNAAQLVLIGDYAWLDNWDDSVPDVFPFWHRRKRTHNIAFMDGYGEYVRIRKGIHVDARYSIVPFKRIREAMTQCQQEIKCP